MCVRFIYSQSDFHYGDYKLAVGSTFCHFLSVSSDRHARTHTGVTSVHTNTHPGESLHEDKTLLVTRLIERMAFVWSLCACVCG